MVKYGVTFTAATRHQYQLQCSKINDNKIAFGNKEHTSDKKSYYKQTSGTTVEIVPPI